jgi:hypothetical protein
MATAITMIGNDVYVAGTEYASGPSVAKLWKNGVPVNLADAINAGYGNAAFRTGSDVYIAGSVYESGTHAAYWKNGARIIADTSSFTSEANGIFIK